MSRRDVAEPRTRFLCLAYNLELLLSTPSTPTLLTGDDLDDPIPRHSLTDTLTSALRCLAGRD
jgi:hypothetical protein